MSARYAKWAPPVGVFALVLAGALTLSTLSGGNGGGAPRRLPLSLRGASGAEGRSAATDTKLAAPAYYGWGSYRIVGSLGDLPGEGPAYRLPGGTADEAAVRRLAEALGVSGEPVRQGGGWQVGTSGKVLVVHDVPGRPWSYGPLEERGCPPGAADCAVAMDGTVSSGIAVARPAYVCPEPAPSPGPEGRDEPADSGEDTVEPQPASTAWPAPSEEPLPEPTCKPGLPPPPPSPPPAPSEDETVAVTRDLLRALGLDPDAARISVEEGWGERTGVVEQVVGGLPTSGWGIRVSVDAERHVVRANGWLADPVREGDYPLLTPQQAIDRMKEGPQPLIARCDALTPECTEEPPDREVTAARLGLVLLWSYDGKEGYLAPAWLLTVQGSPAEEPLLALPDDYLAPPPSDVAVKPEPGGGAGSGEPGSTGECPPDADCAAPGSAGAPDPDASPVEAKPLPPEPAPSAS